MTGSWLTTADHKRLGRMYIVTALGFLLIGGVVGALLRAQLDLSRASHLRLLDLHSTGTAVLVLGPLFVGLATFLVPLQIGSVRLAFPRLQAFAFWAYALGGLAHLLSYTGVGPRLAGLSFSRFTPVGTGDVAHTDLWVATLLLITVASILAAANLAATVLSLRTEGMTLGRLPMFSWATLVSSVGTLLAAPVFLAGLLLLFLDQHFGGHEFFAAGTIGTQVVWQHMLWLYGRPDLYLLVVFGLGAASDIVASAAGRPLANLDAARAGIAGVAFFGFGSWAAGTKVANAIVLPTYSGFTAAAVLPLGLVVLVWLDTLRRAGKPRLDAGMLFVVGFILAIGGGAVAAVVAAIKPPNGTAWSTGQVHLVAFAAPLLLAVGAIHHWSPKLFGRALGTAAAGTQALLLLGGAAVFALGSYAAGYVHVMRAVQVKGSTRLLISEFGGVGFLAGALAVAASVVAAIQRSSAGTERTGESTPTDDGLTLEWATTSPPPSYNFDTLPEVRSATPLADLREAEKAAS